jgi:DNA modification methylase
MFLNDAEQSSIPARVAERASRIGYRLKSYITWTKHTLSPEPVRSRVTRQAEYVIHLTPTSKPPRFFKEQWQELDAELGGPNEKLESRERITDVWSLPVAPGKNGHGAEFPLALPGRCIALSSREGDLVLDPFVGSGTTALAAIRQSRRCIGFDISDSYVQLARRRISEELASEEARRVAASVSAEQMQINMPRPAPTSGVESASTRVRRRPPPRRRPVRAPA